MEQKKIVLVDDDSAIVDSVIIVLEDEYEVIAYADAQPIMSNSYSLPDIFLIDIQLTGISGLDVCKFLKSNEMTRHIPVILFSASTNGIYLAREAGADDFLEKPFRIKALRDCVRKHLYKGSAV